MCKLSSKTLQNKEPDQFLGLCRTDHDLISLIIWQEASWLFVPTPPKDLY